MPKYKFIASLAKRLGVTQAEGRKFLNGFKEEVALAIKAGETVGLSEFGKFKSKDIKERKIFNIHTKQPMIVPARKGVSFNLSSKLKEVING